MYFALFCGSDRFKILGRLPNWEFLSESLAANDIKANLAIAMTANGIP